MIARARLLAVVLVVACGGLGVISSTQTWLSVVLSGAASHDLTVSGAAAVPVLAPLSLAVLALGGALSIVGTVLRYAFGVLTILIAVAQGYLAAHVAFTHPVSAVARTVTDATGIAGDSVSGLISSITANAWPVLTLAVWVLLLAVGVFILATAHRWNDSGRRYRAAPFGRHGAAGRLDAVDSWDELSRGEDPTGSGEPR
ncbi:hypothetical protein GCM10022240_24640 [Microbacterium kribbense]|uniref:Peptidase n=1 Tax=Microbacterium kribbense TaxID=433645 RepID=A0ABP7GNA2_9MICO